MALGGRKWEGNEGENVVETAAGTSQKRATMRVVAHFCFSHLPHSTTDDPGISSTRPQQPTTTSKSWKEPKPAPRPSRISPGAQHQHLGRHKGATTQPCHAKRCKNTIARMSNATGLWRRDHRHAGAGSPIPTYRIRVRAEHQRVERHRGVASSTRRFE